MNQECGDVGWAPAVAAVSHSQLAGLMAGLVFTGIVLLLSLTQRREARTIALVLFGSALAMLLICSFLYGSLSAQEGCAQTWSQMVFAGGLLGLGVLAMFAGLCWLVENDGVPRGVLTLTLISTNIVAVIVGYHLAVTIEEFLDALAPLAQAPGWLRKMVSLYQWVVSGLVLLSLLIGPLRRRHPSRQWALGAAYVYLACVLSAAYLFGETFDLTTAEQWRALGSRGVAAIALVGLVLPGLGLLMQLVALPSTRRSATGP